MFNRGASSDVNVQDVKGMTPTVVQ